MKKNVRLILCCAAVVMLAAGCGKKSDTTETTTAAETTEAEITDKGEVTKLGQYKGIEVTKEDTTVTDAELDQRIAKYSAGESWRSRRLQTVRRRTVTPLTLIMSE